MIESIKDGWHEHYTQTPRHWCPRSEPYTGADSLLTALDQGWQVMDHAVYREVVMFNRRRFTTVFYFHMHKYGRTRVMAVISNPFIIRMLKKQSYHVRAFRDQTAVGEAEPTKLAIPPTSREVASV